MKRQERKVALFLDRSSGHELAVENIGHLLSNVKVICFPGEYTSLLQPIDMGLVHCFKIRHRHKMQTFMASNVIPGKEAFDGRAKTIQFFLRKRGL